jgi:FkbM family methyltransferase
LKSQGANLKKYIKNLLLKFNFEIVRHSVIEELRSHKIYYQNAKDDMSLLQSLPNNTVSQVVNLLGKSKAQLRQDIFVLSHLNFKKNGYFIEFGATNGISLSNTYLLESEFDWNGILAEPAKCWHKDLKNNRKCEIEQKCVWIDSSSTLIFNEVFNAELSTINLFSDNDHHSKSRKIGECYEVNTISLNDLLKKYNAPNLIDYLSIDTEGSEFQILEKLDFSKYSFNVITVEHNFTPMREKIFNLLTKYGYNRKYEELSKWDDWYVRCN